VEFGGILRSVESSGFFTDVGRYFGSVVDVGGYFILVEFGGILGLVESGGFFIVDISGNFKLVDLSGFLGFLFRVGTTNYKTFLLAIKSGK